ncbi:MAG: NAD(P)H-dependent oxidoreductase subunit E [Actinomycetia bacterium]|nr:NAD(P)H-dependent oxidoreductase subunit E [Actinomycetes bacterium]MCP3912492.1 NAD(P)H-dependent oxidoreductase subunit E [Actinomycetes bacterium]
MTVFRGDVETLASEIIGRYPRKRSAMIPLLHLAQETEGYVSEAAMAEIAELVGATSAEVLGTCSFYEMFKREPVGQYLVNICGTMSCQLLGADELIHHAEDKLGIKVGATTDDGLFTLERAECQAACTEAPCLQVNYRHEYRVSKGDFDQLVDSIRNGDRRDDIPPHGTLGLSRQHIPSDKGVGAVPPEQVDGPPVWLPTEEQG